MMMPTKCVVFGANSFLGSNFIEYALANTDWSITASVNINTARINDIGKHDRLTISDKSLAHDRVDVIDSSLAVDKQRPDIIVNFVSQARPRQSIKDPRYTIVNNTDTLVNILEYSSHIKPKLVIHVSTVDIADPSTPYAASKLMQESMCLSYLKSHGVPVAVVRPTNAYGRRQTAENFVPLCVMIVRDRGKIRVYDNGDARRLYVHAYDVAASIVSLHTPKVHNKVKRSSELLSFNVTGATMNALLNKPLVLGKTPIEMASLVSEVLGIPAKIEIIEPPSYYNPKQTLPKDSKFISMSGKYTSEGSLRETIQWISDNPRWL